MARKNKKALVQSPPPAVSSSDATASSSDDDTTGTFPSPSPTSTKNLVPDDGDSSDQSSSSSDSPPKPKPKPVVSSQPESERKTIAALPSKKRPSENKTSTAKKARKEKPSFEPASSNGAGATTPSQKVLFQRVWSLDDELMILKGLIEYRGKYGVDPMSKPDDFFEFIKRSVQVPDVKKNQLVRKIRTMKKKFNNARMKSQPFKNPKDLEAFVLGKRIWESEADRVPVTAEANEPVLKLEKANGKFEDGEDADSDDEEEVEEDEKEDDDEGKVKSVSKFGKYENSDFGLIDVETMFSEASGAVVKRVMEKLEVADKDEMRKKVKRANIASLEAYLSRLDVLKFAAKKILDDFKSH